jgi:hypothetical protein
MQMAAKIDELIGAGKSLRAAARELQISPGSAHAIQREFR